MEKDRRRGAQAIPDKLYFRIGEVSEIVGVKPYVLRYWETEFPDIRPSKSKSGQRLYKRRDVELLLMIKGLLYDERFTINGARKRLKECLRGEQQERQPADDAGAPRQLEVFPASPPPAKDDREPQRDASKVLLKIKRDLESILEIVRAPDG